MLFDSVVGFVWFSLLLAMSFVVLVLRGYCWHWIMVLVYVDYWLMDVYVLTVVGYMGNNVFLACGGEVLKIVIFGL